MTAPPAATSAKPAGIQRGHFFRRNAPHIVFRAQVYLRYKLSYRDLVETMAERGLPAAIRRAHRAGAFAA
jgi:transposase-like protein